MSVWRLNIVLLCLILQGCFTNKKALHKTELLEVEQLSMHTYVHRSFLYDNKWGKVACNGLVYVKDNEAIVFDTPPNDSAAVELIKWIKQYKGATVKAVVVNHFHGDCLGGLGAFHRAGVPSYSNELTRALAVRDTANKPVVPQHGFTGELVLEIGGKQVMNKYYGPAHTRDNIVSYVPEDRVLFGGCMVKSVGSGKGNLNDADTLSWPHTVGAIKSSFPEAKYVVPGHGAHGNRKLLDYTIELFTARMYSGTGGDKLH